MIVWHLWIFICHDNTRPGPDERNFGLTGLTFSSTGNSVWLLPVCCKVLQLWLKMEEHVIFNAVYDIPIKGYVLSCGCGRGKDLFYLQSRKFGISGLRDR